MAFLSLTVGERGKKKLASESEGASESFVFFSLPFSCSSASPRKGTRLVSSPPPPQRSVARVSCRLSAPGPRAPVLCLSRRTRVGLAKWSKGRHEAAVFALLDWKSKAKAAASGSGSSGSSSAACPRLALPRSGQNATGVLASPPRRPLSRRRAGC